MQPRKHLIVYFLIMMILVCCTENPFFKDNQTVVDPRIVRGKVRLSDGRSAQSAFVWLENTGSNTRVNNNGDFSLRLPATGIAGLNGEVTIYFYMGNYAFETVTALVNDGVFVYGKLGIDDQGDLKSTVIMENLLTITTTVQPEQLTVDENDTLAVRVLLQPRQDSSILIITENTREGAFGSLYLKKSGEPVSQARLLGNPSLRPFGQYISLGTTLSVIYDWNDNFLLPGFHALTSGEYEIFPYIRVIQEDLPDALMSGFGENAETFSGDYLNVPYLRTPGTFSVVE